jgi:hypothetical protein
MTDHAIDPLAVYEFHLSALAETVLSVDPFEAQFTFAADGDAITLTIGDDLSVTDVTRHDASESGC